MSLSFCATCGTALVTRPSQSGNAVRRRWPACQTSVYDTPYMVAATLSVVGDRVVLIRRATNPGRGLWSYPGGYLGMGETREETGLAVQIMGLLGAYSRRGGLSVTVVFEAAAERAEWQGDSEVIGIRSFSAAEIPWSELAFWTATYALEDWVYARE